MDAKQIISKLKSLSDPKSVEGMARFGINPKYAYGVSIPKLRNLAKEIGKDHALAKELWKTRIHEARILSGMIAEPEKTTPALMDTWTKDFNSWDLCDQTCLNLYSYSEHAHSKAVEWSKKEPEFVKRAGYALMAVLAVKDKKADDRKFLKFFPHIKRGAVDERNYVKKAVNWAVRQIGKRNYNLYKKAMNLSKEIQKIDSPAAKWIAVDAIRELLSKKEIMKQKN